MKTKIVRIDFEKPLEGQLIEAARIIIDGGLVAFPTETVYGLGASALNSDAASKIYAAKGRPSDNPLIIHISNPAHAEKYCVTSEIYYKLASAFMPGPLTVVLPKRELIPMTVTGGLDTVAVRCPSNAVANTMIRLCGVPVAAPSANISGRPSPTEAETVIREMDGRIDMIIDGGESDIGLESTIVKPTEDGLKLLRPGGITVEQLRDLCGNVIIDKAVTEKLDDKTKPEAPGMKYRHYAPKVKVTLIICEDDITEKAAGFIQEKIKENPKTGALCSDEVADRLKGKYIVKLGRKEDVNEHAHRLFSALRSFDDTDVERIYAVADEEKGIGLALYNRMIKAAGYDIIKI